MRRIESMAARVVAGTIALGLAGAALSGCAESDTHNTWRFAITCEGDATPEIISRDDINIDGILGDKTVIDVSCFGEDGFSTPVGVENVPRGNDSSENILVAQTTSSSGGIVNPGETPEVSTTLIPAASIARIEIANISSVGSVGIN